MIPNPEALKVKIGEFIIKNSEVQPKKKKMHIKSVVKWGILKIFIFILMNLLKYEEHLQIKMEKFSHSVGQ